MLAATVTCLLAQLVCLASGDDAHPPEVISGATRIVGSWMTSYRGREFAAFRAIPYAKPPVGALRFRSPVPIGLPHGLLDATRDPPPCIQKYALAPKPEVTGQEDCLYINVYSHPELTNLPVLVYIHGGGWFGGSSSSTLTGPKLLMDRDIVLVTFNYRLGILGFLNMQEESAAGNMGMKDQVAALRWVRDHVAAFGGDPAAVTICGESAGAASVHFHMLSPLSAGLFQRAISNSGSAVMAPALPTADPEAVGRRHAALVGCDAAPSTPASRVVACLRRVDAARLVDATSLLKVFWEFPVVPYRPTVETSGDRRQRFLPAAPLDLLKEALANPGAPAPFAKVPWLTGIVADEGILMIINILTTPALLSEMNGRLDEVMQVMLELPASVGNRSSEVWRTIKRHYFPGQRRVQLGEHTVRGFIDVNTDRLFSHSLHNAVLSQRMVGHKNIFVYSFEYLGMYSYASFFANTTRKYGVCHADDLLYLLSSPAIFPPFPEGSPDWKVVDALVTLWTNFAKYGQPTPPQPLKHGKRPSGGCADAVEDVWWPTTTDTRSLPYLQIAANENRSWPGAAGVLKFCMRDDLLRERIAFWDSLPLQENSLQQYWRFLPAEGGLQNPASRPSNKL